MNCPWCSNINYLADANCAHCGEAMSLEPEPEPGELFVLPASTPAEAGLRARSVAVWKSFAVSAVAVVALAGGGVATVHRWPIAESLLPIPRPTPPVPTASADPYSQIVATNALLHAIKITRAKVPDTLGSCANLSSDVEALDQVVQERSGQVADATNLRVDSLVGGPPLKSALVDMANKTLTADQAYLTWAQDASTFCTDVNQDAALGQANQDAADAKRHFLKLWRPISSPFDEPKYKWQDF
jgi:hypothetical protein